MSIEFRVLLFTLNNRPNNFGNEFMLVGRPTFYEEELPRPSVHQWLLKSYELYAKTVSHSHSS